MPGPRCGIRTAKEGAADRLSGAVSHGRSRTGGQVRARALGGPVNLATKTAAMKRYGRFPFIQRQRKVITHADRRKRSPDHRGASGLGLATAACCTLKARQ
ncbi:hypothetical protein GCM10020295_80970 [Streptomyces cinereospinus]